MFKRKRGRPRKARISPFAVLFLIAIVAIGVFLIHPIKLPSPAGPSSQVIALSTTIGGYPTTILITLTQPSPYTPPSTPYTTRTTAYTTYAPPPSPTPTTTYSPSPSAITTPQFIPSIRLVSAKWYQEGKEVVGGGEWGAPLLGEGGAEIKIRLRSYGEYSGPVTIEVRKDYMWASDVSAMMDVKQVSFPPAGGELELTVRFTPNPADRTWNFRGYFIRAWVGEGWPPLSWIYDEQNPMKRFEDRTEVLYMLLRR